MAPTPSPSSFRQDQSGGSRLVRILALPAQFRSDHQVGGWLLYCNAVKTLLLALIDGYRLLLSPFFGRQCRFYPSCSAYAREAIEVHGSLKGSWLALKRIVRCGPWHPGGPDPVPPAPTMNAER